MNHMTLTFVDTAQHSAVWLLCWTRWPLTFLMLARPESMPSHGMHSTVVHVAVVTSCL
jgi:hypothetical protein